MWFLTDQGALVDVPKPGAGDRSMALTGCRLTAPDRVLVSFRVGNADELSLDVFDVQGRLWARANVHPAAAGVGETSLQLPRALASGVYLVGLRQGDRSAARKFVVMR